MSRMVSSSTEAPQKQKSNEAVYEQVKDTIIIDLDEQMFNSLSWASAFDFIN